MILYQKKNLDILLFTIQDCSKQIIQVLFKFSEAELEKLNIKPPNIELLVLQNQTSKLTNLEKIRSSNSNPVPNMFRFSLSLKMLKNSSPIFFAIKVLSYINICMASRIVQFLEGFFVPCVVTVWSEGFLYKVALPELKNFTNYRIFVNKTRALLRTFSLIILEFSEIKYFFK